MARLRIARDSAIAGLEHHGQQIAVAVHAGVIAAIRFRAAQVKQGDRQQPQGGKMVPNLAAAYWAVT